MTLSFIRKVTLLRMAIDMATMAIAKNSFRGARAIFDKKYPGSRSSRTPNNPSGYGVENLSPVTERVALFSFRNVYTSLKEFKKISTFSRSFSSHQ